MNKIIFFLILISCSIGCKGQKKINLCLSKDNVNHCENLESLIGLCKSHRGLINKDKQKLEVDSIKALYEILPSSIKRIRQLQQLIEEVTPENKDHILLLCETILKENSIARDGLGARIEDKEIIPNIVKQINRINSNYENVSIVEDKSNSKVLILEIEQFNITNHIDTTFLKIIKVDEIPISIISIESNDDNFIVGSFLEFPKKVNEIDQNGIPIIFSPRDMNNYKNYETTLVVKYKNGDGEEYTESILCFAKYEKENDFNFYWNLISFIIGIFIGLLGAAILFKLIILPKYKRDFKFKYTEIQNKNIRINELEKELLSSVKTKNEIKRAAELEIKELKNEIKEKEPEPRNIEPNPNSFVVIDSKQKEEMHNTSLSTIIKYHYDVEEDNRSLKISKSTSEKLTKSTYELSIDNNKMELSIVKDKLVTEILLGSIKNNIESLFEIPGQPEADIRIFKTIRPAKFNKSADEKYWVLESKGALEFIK